MKNTKTFFHYISYLQYPLLLIAFCYSLRPYIYGFDSIWIDYNNVLLFAGLGISFSTLQDTQKTQNNFSKRIWEDPKKGKAAVILIAVMALLIILLGLFGLYASKDDILKSLTLGIFVFGIGLLGILKTAIEMFENHRKDKRTGLK